MKTVDSSGLLLLGAYRKSPGGGPGAAGGESGRELERRDARGVGKHEAPAGILVSNQ